MPSIDYHASPNPNTTNRLAIDNVHISTTKITIHGYATQIVRYLAQCDSRVKVLAVSPHRQPDSNMLPEKDDHGHRWPNYHYLRGREVDARGIERVALMPLAYANLEMPESTILSRY
jgi:hypothetical protein